MRKWQTIITTLIVVLLTFLALPVLAGEGDGSGGGQGVPLGLASSVPSDGQKDVTLTGDIKLTFNKNVINLTIRDNNKTCFAMFSANGTKVPIVVVMADDQLYPEEKRNISIRPLQKLQPGTAYILRISPQLQAKNGTSLGHEVTVNFITAGVAAKPVELAPVSEAEKTQTELKQTAPTPTDITATITNESSHPVEEKVQTAEQQVQPSEEKKTQVDDKSATTQPEESKQKSSLPIALAAGAVTIVALGYALYKRRNR